MLRDCVRHFCRTLAIALWVSSRAFFLAPVVSIVLIASILGSPSLAQTANQRLILKDGSYQIVTEYKVVGQRVRFFSAERADWEEIPKDLVDWAATEKWAKDHAPGANAVPPVNAASPASPADAEAAAIDKEEQQERSRTPEVSSGLRLPDQEGVWALDSFHDQPELVELAQNTGNVNQQTGHNILRSALNSSGGLKQAIWIPGGISKIQLHVDDPAFYVSLTTGDNDLSTENALTVDTHGAPPPNDKDSYSSPNSGYAIVRVVDNMRHTYRVVGRILISPTGNVSQTSDIIPTIKRILPGGHWLKLTPSAPLTIGDYALVEILAPGEINASVWDFRVDPQGPDNKNAIMPLRPSSER